MIVHPLHIWHCSLYKCNRREEGREEERQEKEYACVHLQNVYTCADV